MHYFIWLIILYYTRCTKELKITTKPSSAKYKNNIPLFWKIAKKNTFTDHKPKRYIFNEYPIAIYKDYNDNINAISDICMHRGASLSGGKILKNNCLQCPYHGWEYENGLVKHIPGYVDSTNRNYGVPQFEIKEVNDDIFIRPTFDINSKKGNTYNHTIYVPPEAYDSNFVRISGERKIFRPNNIITENVIDMMHISYVHSFGNSLSPVPFNMEYEDLNELSGRSTFHYTAGPNSMSKIIGGAKFVTVENEFHLPDVTVTRVTANNIVKTIVTHSYPIGQNESILHFDLYRNFLQPPIFDPLFHYQMKLTLDEDTKILYRIYDDYMLGFMSTKFDITQIKYREKVKRLQKNIDSD